MDDRSLRTARQEVWDMVDERLRRMSLVGGVFSGGPRLDEVGQVWSVPVMALIQRQNERAAVILNVIVQMNVHYQWLAFPTQQQVLRALAEQLSG
mgnify:FL=1